MVAVVAFIDRERGLEVVVVGRDEGGGFGFLFRRVANLMGVTDPTTLWFIRSEFKVSHIFLLYHTYAKKSSILGICFYSGFVV